MTAFTYREGALHAEDVALARIAAEVGTPVYVYATSAMEAQYDALVGALAGLDALVCYAVKANSNLAVIRTFARRGAGADVVSEGELRRALAAGVPASKIIFSGIGKTEAEMEFALRAGIGQFNVESEPEMIALSRIATRLGLVATVALRINPDVDAGSHAKITTGRKENKFGIDLAHAADVFRRGAALPGLAVRGLAVHIGSQLLDVAPFRAAFDVVGTLARALRNGGHPIDRLDFGGGIGITYRDEPLPDLALYAAIAREAADGLGCRLVFEPGRFLVGNAGVLLTRVLYVKDGVSQRFVIVDAAMNDLIRPTLYDAYHGIDPVLAPAPGAPLDPVDVVGPVCETGDLFAAQHVLPPVAAGALLVIRSAGAYGAVMASEYNSRPLVPEVLVKGGHYAVVRPRPTYESMLGLDRMPDWLGP
ncbi:MAG: diaminopimelate decarboxylase [Alphaproteobacteria bacterium]|nr:diaminopimelate decarboxylase [Alphaproteobacteria bacterium]